jgi:uncharacterized protein
MMEPDDVTPRMRNFYTEDEYFTLNVRSGVIRNPSGHRIVGLPVELLIGLHRGIEDETGSAAGVILYSCGKWWGKQFIKRHGTEVRQFYGMDAGDMNLHFYLQVLRRVWALYGWGALDIGFGIKDKGYLEILVGSTIFSDAVGAIGRPADPLVAGVLAAVFSHASGRELECTETACRSKGDPTCAFIVGTKPRIDVIASWVKQGRSHVDVVAAIEGDQLI